MKKSLLGINLVFFNKKIKILCFSWERKKIPPFIFFKPLPINISPAYLIGNCQDIELTAKLVLLVVYHIISTSAFRLNKYVLCSQLLMRNINTLTVGESTD